MTKIEPAQDLELDLAISMATFAVPGAGKLSADDGDEDDDKKGPVTVGTTCWGTPCPSANTVSC